MKILVIDDHPLFADGLQQVLELMDDGVEVLQAFTAEEAFTLLGEQQAVEMILVDFSLPGMDGIDFLRIQRDRGSSVPTVLISAHDDVQMVHEALESGASGFIPKSFRAAELVEALRRMLAGEVFVPLHIASQLERPPRVDNDRAPVDARGRAYGVTPKQCRVLELLAKGMSNRDIAGALSLSEHTVKSHLKTIYGALQVKSRTQCIKRAEQLGIIGSDHDQGR